MRPEKESIATEIKERLKTAPYVIMTDFTGLTVQGFSELRARLLKANARAMVVKNNIVRHTLKDLQMPDLNGALEGPTAIVYGEKDLAAAASVLKNFTQEFKKLKVKGGILDKKVLNSQEINAIADLPPREVLQAQLLGVLSAPATKFVRLMKTPAEQLVRILKAKSEKAN